MDYLQEDHKRFGEMESYRYPNGRIHTIYALFVNRYGDCGYKTSKLIPCYFAAQKKEATLATESCRHKYLLR